MSDKVITPMDYVHVSFGADPEFFFKKHGKVIGAEKFLPEEGLKLSQHSNATKFIIDGVQAELNPLPSTCRQVFAEGIQYAFRLLVEEMNRDEHLSVTFEPTVEVTQEEFDSLKESSKTFGCTPSENFYGTEKSRIRVNPKTYLKRSAGGHVHLGAFQGNTTAVFQPERLVPILDIVLGNTCVLLDRDEGNIERRKVYGRAGEYRTPSHGTEYRTLSNFWLRHYQLMSMVMGLARLAVIIVHNNRDEELKSLVNMSKIETAINNNDFELAMANFQNIKEWLLENIGTAYQKSHPIHPAHIKEFEFFIEKGLDFWFKEDPLHHWTTTMRARNIAGFESFLENTVRREMEKSK